MQPAGRVPESALAKLQMRFSLMKSTRWYAFTTQPRHEKAVARQLESKSIESFVPLLTTPSRRKDRRAVVDQPLFPGYVFTRIDAGDRAHVLRIPSVVRVLSFNGVPADIADEEIDAVRRCLIRGENPEPHPFPEQGDTVRVKSGPLQGLQGVIIRCKSSLRLVVSINLIHKSIATEVSAQVLEPVNGPSILAGS
jgi:transcription antitermination factor NusG